MSLQCISYSPAAKFFWLSQPAKISYLKERVSQDFQPPFVHQTTSSAPIIMFQELPCFLAIFSWSYFQI